MEYGSIERQVRIEASPEVVFEVVSAPEHVREWWPDEVDYEAKPGGAGEIVFHSPEGEKRETFEVVDVVPPSRFSFRWTQPAGERARVDNSFLVTFELAAEGDGTLLRMTETGFRERGWEAAVLQEAYRDHAAGWDHFLARLWPYAATVGAAVR